jgi:hypothetical protein
MKPALGLFGKCRLDRRYRDSVYDYGIDLAGLGIGTCVSHEEIKQSRKDLDDAIIPLDLVGTGDAKRAISATNT